MTLHSVEPREPNAKFKFFRIEKNFLQLKFAHRVQKVWVFAPTSPTFRFQHIGENWKVGVDVGVHLARFSFTQSIHFFRRHFASWRSSLRKGIGWSEMPLILSGLLSHSATWHLAGIFSSTELASGTSSCVSFPGMTWRPLAPRSPLGLFFRVLDTPNWLKNGTLKSHIKITRGRKDEIFSVSGWENQSLSISAKIPERLVAL